MFILNATIWMRVSPISRPRASCSTALRKTKDGYGARPGSPIRPAIACAFIAPARIAASRPGASNKKGRSGKFPAPSSRRDDGGGLFRHDSDGADHLGVDGADIFVGARLAELVRE